MNWALQHRSAESAGPHGDALDANVAEPLAQILRDYRVTMYRDIRLPSEAAPTARELDSPAAHEPSGKGAATEQSVHGRRQELSA
jgi:hypothetical protein